MFDDFPDNQSSSIIYIMKPYEVDPALSSSYDVLCQRVTGHISSVAVPLETDGVTSKTGGSMTTISNSLAWLCQDLLIYGKCCPLCSSQILPVATTTPATSFHHFKLRFQQPKRTHNCSNMIYKYKKNL